MCSLGYELAWIQYVVGIKHALESTHNVEFNCALVAREFIAFGDADTVFGTDGSANSVRFVVNCALNPLARGEK
jgi:hypothetical protein